MGGRLQDKVVVVTGAGSIAEGWGIGKATAVACARAGARVVAADIDADAARATAAIIAAEGGEALAVTVDVADPQSVAALAAAAVERFGRVTWSTTMSGSARSAGRSTSRSMTGSWFTAPTSPPC